MCAGSTIKESQAYTGVISRGCPIGTGINANRAPQVIGFCDNSYVILAIPRISTAYHVLTIPDISTGYNVGLGILF